MCEETEEIIKMVRQLQKQVKGQRVMESQSNCHLGFVYSQGCIDMSVDILDNIERIQRERKNNGAVEVV